MLKKISILIIVSTIVSLIFLGYMYFIGIPKTQARNYFNLSVIEKENGNTEKELEYLIIAKEYWAEEYIVQRINELQ